MQQPYDQAEMYSERRAGGLRFVVVGMSDEASPVFTPEIQRLINEHRVFSGGLRHYELVAGLLPEDAKWISVTVPLSEVYDQYRAHDCPILVFASGDPLFYGYTTTLMRVFPGLVDKTFPSFSSLQLLSHAFTLPYHDMRFVSLTGRPWDGLDRALIEREGKIGVLTDKHRTPAAIADRMLTYGYSEYEMLVGVCLGGAREELHRLSLEEARGRSFGHPNCVALLLRPDAPKEYAAPMGLREQNFFPLNGRVNMITKMPIRLLSLSLLELHRCRVLWDVGFCTGSVSIEARLQFPHLSIRAFEVREEGEELMQVNSTRFRAPGIEYHIGDFLAQPLEDYPQPDAVFIGGHGGEMQAFVERIVGLITERGVIVFNSVSEKSLGAFRTAIASVGWSITAETTIKVDEHNPITCLQAKATPPKS